MFLLSIPYSQLHIPRILSAQNVFFADIQAAGGRNHDKHHRRKNADRCQTCTVALHPVQHGGNGNKVIWLIIVALPFFQPSAQHDRAGNKDQVGPKNDHQHRCEKIHQCRYRIHDRHRNVVRAGQKHHTQDRQQQIPFGWLFTLCRAMQQPNRIGHPDLAQIVQ